MAFLGKLPIFASRLNLVISAVALVIVVLRLDGLRYNYRTRFNLLLLVVLLVGRVKNSSEIFLPF